MWGGGCGEWSGCVWAEVAGECGCGLAGVSAGELEGGEQGTRWTARAVASRDMACSHGTAGVC